MVRVSSVTFERSSGRLDQLSELEGRAVRRVVSGGRGGQQLLLEDVGLLSEGAVVEEVDRVVVLERRHVVAVDEIVAVELGHLDERGLVELVLELIASVLQLQAATERLARVGAAHDQVLVAAVQACHWDGHSHVVLARLTTARVVLASQLAERAGRPVDALLAVFSQPIERDVEQVLAAADQHESGVAVVVQ